MQKIATRLGFVALLTAGLIGCGIVFTAQFHDQFLLTWCAATIYFLALVVASRSKGRSRAWSAWGLIPVLG